MKKMFLILMAPAVMSASATTWYYTGSGYKSDAFTNTSYWSGANGEPCTGFASTDEFVVENWKWLWSPAVQDGNEHHFTGKSLTIGIIGEKFGAMEVRVYSSTTKCWFDNEGLFLDNGRFTHYAGYRNRVAPVYGNITVRSPTSAPVWIYHRGGSDLTYTNNTMALNGPFSSPVTAGAILGGRTDASAYATNFTLRILGSCANYLGRLELRGLYPRGSSYDSRLQLGPGTDFAGTLVVSTNGILGAVNATDVVSVGTLAFHPDSWLQVVSTAATNSIFVVTNSFSAEGPVNVEFASSKIVANNDGVHIPIITAPVDADINTNDFRMAMTGAEPVYPSVAYRLAARTVGERKSLDVEIDPIVTLTTADTDTYSKGYSSAFTNDTSWSDGRAPRPGRHYVAPSKVLRTPETDSFRFEGESLTIDGKIFHVFTGRLSLPLLRLRNTSMSTGIRAGHVTVAADRLELVGPTNGIVVQIDCEMELESALVGDGTLRMIGNNVYGSNGKVRLSGDNTGFLGKFLLAAGQTAPDPDTVYQTLYASSEANLGGKLDEMTYDALALTAYGTFATTNSFAITAANNRGIFVGSTTGRVDVTEGETLAVGTQLTLDGTLVKRGAGTLALGGTLRFGPDGEGAVPSAATAAPTIHVTEGALGVSAADAVNGAQVIVDSAASLSLDVVSAAGDLVTYGIRNTLAAAPFVAEGAATIRLKVGGTPASDATFECALFTAADATAYAAMDAIITPVRERGLRGWSMTCVSRPNGDGSVTKVATFERRGLILLVH